MQNLAGGDPRSIGLAVQATAGAQHPSRRKRGEGSRAATSDEAVEGERHRPAARHETPHGAEVQRAHRCLWTVLYGPGRAPHAGVPGLAERSRMTFLARWVVVYGRNSRMVGVFALGLLAGSGGCEDGDGSIAPTQFESDLPDRLRDRETPAFDGGGAAPPEAPDAARMIAEADIVQVDGDQLYALSRYGGLHVIDVGTPGELRWLGAYHGDHDAEPFEMYLRDGVALVMFTSWGQYVENDAGDGYAWVQSSKVLALDIGDPKQIRELGSFTVPGAISDSRIVGDVLYVVGYQDGSCWGCEQGKPRTAIVSLDVSVPADVKEVDELTFDDDDNQWGWNRRSIHVTTERMYVAGIEYGDNGPIGSTIDVIDISDPTGLLVSAASIEAEGQVSSRWQIDEHAGVLRVLSQPPAWDLQAPPVVQTFAIVSSQEFAPLGRTELTLPRPEQLQSVRFDGARAYAITAERQDPLFTIDLSDPAKPLQRGELEIPGFVYHMEPRGDRVIGLGFDQGSAEGAITVSLFDVSDLDQPTMLQRVQFGGSWASLPEDQDRIHKVFRVLDDLGLILVPHTGSSEARCGESGSGVQLVDWEAANDTLALRGAVPVRGEARRALVHEDQLLTVSDERVESFDLGDRDAPVLADGVALTRNVQRTVPLASGKVARIAQDFWSSTAMRLDVVDAAEVDDPQPAAGEIDLGELLADGSDGCNSYVWVEDAFAMGDLVIVAFRSERWDDPMTKARGGLLVFDTSVPDTPEVRSTIDWAADQYWWFDGFYDYGVPATRSAIVHTQDAVAMLETTYLDGKDVRRLRVVDLRDPDAPDVVVMALDAAAGQGGLLAVGDAVVTSHYEPASEGDAVRFYLDRFDVSDPSAPRALPSVNVPGTVLHYDADTGRAVTADLVRVDNEDTTWDECADRYATFEFEYASSASDRGPCIGYRQRLHLVRVEGATATRLDTHALEEDQALRASDVGAGVMYATVGRGVYRGWFVADCVGPCGYSPSEPSTLLVLGGLDEDVFEAGMLEVDSDAWWGWWSPTPVHAVGDYALVVGEDDALIVDARDPSTPVVVRTEALGGYVQHVSVTDTDAFLSLGPYGARRIRVP